MPPSNRTLLLFRPTDLLARVRKKFHSGRSRAEFEREVEQRTNNLRVALSRLQDEIAERQRVDQALRESEELSRLAMQAGRTYGFEWDPATNLVRRSHNCSDILGITGDASRDTWSSCIERVHPDDRSDLLQRMGALKPDADSCECDYRVIGSAGEVIYLHSVIRAMFDERGTASRYIGFVVDTTRTRKAEAALNESEERFRSVADAAPVMICASGPDKLATYFNQAWLAFTGRRLSEELGHGWTAGVHPDDLEQTLAGYSECFERRGNCHLEYRLRRADGDYRWIVCSGVPRFSADGEFRGYVASAIDISDTKRAQEEAFDRQKLESLRVLTGGIAHDFNNLLGSILVETELAEAELAEDLSPLECIGRIRGIARRAAEIVRELMIYSGQDNATLEALNLSTLVEEMCELLRSSISRNADLKTDLPKDLPLVMCNAAQMRQVVLNLVVNASDATDGRGGSIMVRTSSVPQKTNDNRSGDAGVHGGYVRLEVADRGCGIPEEIQGRIFEPFFSTKPCGHGLGLSVVQGIVHSHGGTIQLNSTQGCGSTFDVLLAGVTDVPANPAPAMAGIVRPNCGMVLLVEDEDSLRVAVGKALRRRGYSLLSAADGRTAVELFREHWQDFAVVVLDLTLPELPGAEALKQIHGIAPGTPVILTSGYDRDDWRSVGEPSKVRFLKKPYHIDELVELLRASSSGV